MNPDGTPIAPEAPAPAEPTVAPVAPEAPVAPVEPTAPPAPVAKPSKKAKAKVTPAEVPPPGDKDGDAVADEKARLEREAKDAAEDAAKASTDLSPEAEAALPNAGTDGSNIGQTTTGDFHANLPKNANGQVEIDEDGKVVGL